MIKTGYLLHIENKPLELYPNEAKCCTDMVSSSRSLYFTCWINTKLMGSWRQKGSGRRRWKDRLERRREQEVGGLYSALTAHIVPLCSQLDSDWWHNYNMDMRFIIRQPQLLMLLTERITSKHLITMSQQKCKQESGASLASSWSYGAKFDNSTSSEEKRGRISRLQIEWS